MNNIILIGGGGHCRSVIDVIEQEGRFKIYGIVDKSEFLEKDILGNKIIGSDKDLKKLAEKSNYAFITVGQIKSSLARIKLFNMAKKLGFILPAIISPRAYVSKHSSVGSGTVVMHDAIVNANAKVGDNCIINTKAIIEHDCVISNHCHISVNATINGSVKIKSKCFIGSNAVVSNNVLIKERSIIKAHTLVKRSYSV